VLRNLRPVDILYDLAEDISDLRFLPLSTIKDWDLHLKGLSKGNNKDISAYGSLYAGIGSDDFDLEMGDGFYNLYTLL